MSRAAALQAALDEVEASSYVKMYPAEVKAAVPDLLAVVRAAQAALDHADDDCAHWPELDILRAALAAFEEGGR